MTDDNDPWVFINEKMLREAWLKPLGPLLDFGRTVGLALADRKIPEDWDANNLTPQQALEGTARLLDQLDDASDTYLAAKGSDHRVERTMQRDLRAIAASLGRRSIKEDQP